MFYYVVFLNGVYDILCAISMLFLPKVWIFSVFSRLHPSMFTTPIDPITQRILSYWVMTYGAIRISAIMRNDVVDSLVSMTYLFEATVFAFEYIVHGTTHLYKTIWVIISCILLTLIPMLYQYL
jgi:hypothetical protein